MNECGVKVAETGQNENALCVENVWTPYSVMLWLHYSKEKNMFLVVYVVLKSN